MINKTLLTVFLIICTSNALAQNNPERNTLVYFDLSSSISVVDNNFTATWDPSPALNFSVRVPYYQSQIEAGFRYIRFRGSAPTETDSDFQSIFLHLGWLYPINLSPRFTVSPAVRFGSNIMIFDEAEVFTNETGSQRFVTDPRELEFAYELALRSQYRMSDHWYVHASISYNRTLTQIPLPLTLISAGFSYSFDQPKWLKKIL